MQCDVLMFTAYKGVVLGPRASACPSFYSTEEVTSNPKGEEPFRMDTQPVKASNAKAQTRLLKSCPKRPSKAAATLPLENFQANRLEFSDSAFPQVPNRWEESQDAAFLFQPTASS